MKKKVNKLEIKELINDLEKQFGKNALIDLGVKINDNVDTIKSGSLTLDLALGVNGYPKGRIIEIYGHESSGKTTLTLHAIKQAQNQKIQCAFIDAEHSIDADYAKNLGIETKKLLLSQPDSGEQALGIVEALVKSNQVGLIVVDSVAALVPQVELDGEMSDQTIGVQARLMSKALRKISGIINKSNCTLMFINQVRSKIGVIYGNPETTSGGRALKFYSSIRLEVSKGTRIMEDNKIIGQEMRVKVVKNKLAPPFKKVVLNLIYGKGIDQYFEIISLGITHNIITKAGSWYSYKKDQLGQGLKKVVLWLQQNPSSYQQIKKEIIDKLKANSL